MLLQPAPGFGLDARLPMGKEVRCYLSAEAYIHGGSAVIFGLESVKFPWLRLQVAPCTRVSLRVPLAQVSDFKWVLGGGYATVYKEGVRLRPKFGGFGKFWESVRGFVGGLVEVEHKNNLLGTFFDAKQRRVMKDVLNEIDLKRKERRKRITRDRASLEEIAPLDPRKIADPVEKLKKALKDKYGEGGILKAGKGKEALLRDLEKKMMSKDFSLHDWERENSLMEEKQ